MDGTVQHLCDPSTSLENELPFSASQSRKKKKSSSFLVKHVTEMLLLSPHAYANMLLKMRFHTCNIDVDTESQDMKILYLTLTLVWLLSFSCEICSSSAMLAF